MLRVLLGEKRPLNVLCLGAHCDDIEIGCGGTMLHLLERYPGTVFTWVVFTSNKLRAAECMAAAGELLANDDGHQLTVLSFRDGFLPDSWREVKEEFEALKKRVTADLIFTHYRDDLHQDHRIINQLTWNTFREHLILEYEIPKYDGDMGRPNLYCGLTEGISRKKVKVIVEKYRSQAEKRWFCGDTFLALMRLRGVEIDSGTLFAEAFYCRKIIF
jgi:LmbE family N-acetylglucosaminyl deacetylase